MIIIVLIIIIIIIIIIISPEECCTKSDTYYFKLYLFKDMNDSFFKLMITIDNGILLKSHASWNFMLKHYITILLQQNKKTLNRFLNLSRAKGNLEIWINQSNFESLALDNVLIN